MPFWGSVTAKSYAYFSAQFNFSSTSAILHIDVLALVGDPDLFVGRGPRHPSLTSYIWKSDRLSNDSVTVPPTDPNACRSPDCTYSIAVYSAINSSFSIVVTLDSPHQLVAGVPQSSSIVYVSNEYYYYIIPPSGAVVDFTVAASAGRVNSFFSCSTYPDPNTPSSYLAAIFWYNVVPTLTINTSSVAAFPPPPLCS